MGWAKQRRTLGIGALAVAVVAVAASAMAVRDHHVRDAWMRADPETILARPELARAALAAGHDGFVAHCASCHGAGNGDPARGIPDLTDRDFLYGTGQVAEIEQIVLHGIRSGDPRGWNLASMPAYARARPYAAEPIPPMTPGDIHDVAQFLVGKHAPVDPAAAARGAKIYGGRGACWDCHGNDGSGNPSIGAPNLLDTVWLYGNGSQAAIEHSLVHGRAGASPAYARKLSPAQARAIAVYVAALAAPKPRG